MGARCNPTPPACDGNGPVCAPDQLEVCLNQCVTPGARGEECSTHPCDGSGLPPCGTGLLCVEEVPDRDRFTCQPGAPLDQIWCRTFGDRAEACPTGQYCRGFENAVVASERCPGLRATQGVTPPLYDGICSLPAREGRECEGNWGDPGTCHACEPGTECRDDVPGWNGERVCVRVCQNDGDCPCPSQLENVLDVCTQISPTSAESVCTNCVALGAACDTSSSWGCCDDGALCAGVCCLGAGATCSSTDDCCGTALCAGDGTCHACTNGGQPIDRKGPGCCSGEPPDAAGICPVTCFVTRGPNRVQVVEGEACGSGACAGIYDCDRDRGSGTCVVMNAPPETFDCTDNDCDGRVDEGTSRDCMGTPQAFEEPNFDGCPDLEPLPGTLVCRGGAPVCSVTRGWCAWDNLGNPIDHSGMGEECFSGGSADCNGFNCLAGEWCCSTNPSTGNPGCTRIGVVLVNGMEVELPGHEPPSCWLPEQENTDRTCPVVEDCNDHFSCGDCAADSNCGWCHGYGRCLPGDDMGPNGVDLESCRRSPTDDGWYRDAMECGG